MRQHRGAGFAAIGAIYVVAAAVGVIVFLALPQPSLPWRVLAGDLAATLFVWLAGVALRNASVYDPYWSVAPIVILTGLAARTGKLDAGTVLLLVAIWYWGVRLTANWAVTFINLSTQDWRYDDLKAKFPRLFQLVSLTGITLFPTIVVYLCLLPAVEFVRRGGLNAWTVAGFAVCVGAATLQLVADAQMQAFRRAHALADDGGTRHEIIRTGLWRHARHPNYLGEIAMWWGVYLMMLSVAPGQWVLGAGALVNTGMFLFVSIPMADRRNAALRPGFDAYRRETNSLLPLRLPGKPAR